MRSLARAGEWETALSRDVGAALRVDPRRMVSLNFVHRHPVAVFWLVAVGLELLLIPLFLVSGADAEIQRGLDTAGLDFNTDLVTAGRVVAAEPAALWGVLLSLGQVASPDLAVLLVAGLVLQGGALREVTRRFRFWSPEVGAARGLRLWAACVSTFCAMNLASAGLHALGPDNLGFTWDVRPLSVAFATGLLVAMFLDAGALFEENGWRGFALPRLQALLGPLRAATVVGLLWAAWHLPVKFNLLLDYGAAPFALLFCVMIAKFVALSVVMSYFFNRAGAATILAVAMHGLSNDSVRLGGLVESDAFAAQLRAEVDLLIPLATVALGLVALTRGRLGTDAWENRRVPLSVALRPFRRPHAARRLALELAAVLTGAGYAVVLVLVVPVVGALSLVGVGIPLALAALSAGRGLSALEGRRFGVALGIEAKSPPAPPSAGAGLLARALRLARAPQTWRAVGWIGARAASGAAVSVVLLVAAVATLSLALIPFVDEWLVWGSWSTHSGAASAWTLLLLPIPVMVTAHALDLLGSGLVALAPRLLGPDPADELEVLRDRATRLRDRTRLASELHDAIGHTLTVVTLQAAAAGRALDDDPEAARRALAAIEHAGRRAAEQLDGVLATLGADHADADGAAEPQLTDLPDLVSALRAAGVAASLETIGSLAAVPEPLAGELYRMAQEACANVMRHAGAVETVIEVRVEPGRVALEVRNAGGGVARPTARARASSGRGLPSIDRRARRLGGTARSGGLDDGGFLVRVELPLAA